MSEFTTYDLEECLRNDDHEPIQKENVNRVIKARGEGPREWADWTGEFLLALNDGRYALVSGWCDSSGWG